LGRVLGQEKPDLEALEMAIRDSVHQIGCRWLETVLNSDQGGYGGPKMEVEPGQAGDFLGYRDKEVVTVVGPVNRLLSRKLCLSNSSGLLKTRLKHGIELSKSRGDAACQGSPATLLQR
jgi:hypothetical protein